MKNVLVILMALHVLACGNESDDNRNPVDQKTNDNTTSVGKGDAAGKNEVPMQQEADPQSQDSSQIDLCAEFELYGDGECHTICKNPDSDCSPEELEAARDICEEEGRYGDGQCDRDCRRYDDDCNEPKDVCEVEARYADGACDTDCTHTDSDCDDYEAVNENELSSEETRICARYTGSSRVPIHEVATSLCMGRDGAAIVDCIVQCVKAFNSN